MGVDSVAEFFLATVAIGQPLHFLDLGVHGFRKRVGQTRDAGGDDARQMVRHCVGGLLDEAS